MSKQLKQFQARAREVARSGKFYGWPPLAFELSFEEGFSEAREWVYSAAAREELDRVCKEARKRLYARNSTHEAA